MKKLLTILLLTTSVTLFSQIGDGSTGMGIGLANQTIDGENYQSIALMPELNLGFFGIGLNVDLRFALVIEDDSPTFEIYEDDWIIDDGDWQDYLSLYINKIAYVRLGQKDESFYLKAGQFNGATLGNGTILNDYSNMLYMPETRIFGVALDIDGALFDFPYVGFETFIANVAEFDLVGGRLFVRPFKSLEIPVISNIELGGTGVVDRDPYIFSEVTESDSDDLVAIYGADITIPFIDTPIFSLDIYGDFVIQDETNAQIYGLGGKVISFIDYDLQFQNMGENYVSEYFGAAYDLNRTSSNFEIYNGTTDTIDARQDMSATLGFEVPQILYFDAKLSGLLTMGDDPEESAEDAPYLYPSLKGTLHLDDELLKIFSADFFYYKTGLEDLDSIVDPTNAIIGGSLDYYSGNMVVSFIVDVKYNADAEDDPDTTADEAETDKWITNTQISVNFKF